MKYLILLPLLLPVPFSTKSDFVTQMLLDAEADWGYAVGARVQFTDKWSCDSGYTAADAWPDMWYKAYGNVIRLNSHCGWTAPGYDWDYFSNVLRHEIGHLLGFRHSREGFDLMNAYVIEHKVFISHHERRYAALMYESGYVHSGQQISPDPPPGTERGPSIFTITLPASSSGVITHPSK